MNFLWRLSLILLMVFSLSGISHQVIGHRQKLNPNTNALRPDNEHFSKKGNGGIMFTNVNPTPAFPRPQPGADRADDPSLLIGRGHLQPDNLMQ